MKHTAQDLLASLPPERIIEAAQTLLAGRMGIDEYEAALPLMLNRAGITDTAQRDQFEAMVGAAAAEREEVARFLRIMLADPDMASPAALEATLDEVGSKQVVVSGELYAIGAVLIGLYIVYKTGGVAQRDTRIKVRKLKDGSVEYEFEEKTITFNPFSPVLKLIKRISGTESKEPESLE